MTTWSDAHSNLQALLAELIDRSEDARMIAIQAGLDAKHLNLQGSPMVVWQGILDQAAKEQRLDALLNLVRQRFHHNPQLVGQLEVLGRQLRAQAGEPAPWPAAKSEPYRHQRRAYLDALRERMNYVNTGAFTQQAGPEQTGRAGRLPLLGEQGVYVPLAFDALGGRTAEWLDRSRSQRGRTRRSPAEQEAGPEPSSRLPLAQVLRAPGNLAIIGAAGSGKTTLLHILTTLLTDPDPAQVAPDLAQVLPDPLPLPVFLPLRLFEHACSLQDSAYGRDLAGLLAFLDRWFAGRYAGPVSLPQDFLSRHVREGHAWLLLDALDEVADPMHRQTIRNLINNDLAGDCGATRLIVTARVAGYRDAPLDERFSLFQVSDLDAEQRAMMVRRLYRGLQLPDQAERAGELLDKMEKRPDLAFLTRTPVMVWTAAVIHAFRGSLPEGRAALYDSYVDILLRKSFDVPQYDVSALQPLVEGEGWSLADRRLALSYGAFATHFWQEGQEKRQAEGESEGGRVSLRELADEFLAGYFLDQYWADSRREAVRRARHFVGMMVERSGLLVEDEEGFRFGDHLTMQEFLAACYVAGNYAYDDRQNYDRLVKEQFANPWWREVFLLAVGYLATQGGKEGADLLRLLARQGRTGEERLAALELAATACAQLAVLQAPPRWYGRLRDELAGTLQDSLLGSQRLQAPLRARHLAGLALGRLWGWEGDPRFAGPLGLPEFVEVPAGPFRMGGDPEGRKDEQPGHEVYLDAYAIARLPTTNAMFRHFLEAGGYDEPEFWTEAIDDKRWEDGVLTDWLVKRTQPAFWNDERWNSPAQPVVGVTWYEAVAYCRWLSRETGQAHRLPTEAEWEKAAAWDPATQRSRRYPWGDEWDGERVNSEEADLKQTSFVGLFPGGASALGVQDMAGNVWEWCADWYDEDYYARSPKENPRGPEGGSSRVIRGGSWAEAQTWCRCGSRLRYSPVDWYGSWGFRCARTLS